MPKTVSTFYNNIKYIIIFSFWLENNSYRIIHFHYYYFFCNLRLIFILTGIKKKPMYYDGQNDAYSGYQEYEK